MEEEKNEQQIEEVAPEVVEEQPVKEKKSKKGPVLLGIICCLVIAIAVVMVILLLPSNKSNKDDEKKVVTEKEFKSEYRMTGNSIEKFDLYFLKLENNGKNEVYSPLSIKYALEMLAEGSDGDSKAQIDAVIGDYKAKKYDNNSNMSFANAMFIRDTFQEEVKDEYKDTLKDKYNAEIIIDKFESPSNINKWISDKTFGLIPNLISDVDGKDFFLVNALAIDMKWNYLIHCASGNNKNVPCYTESGTYYVIYDHEKLQGEDYEYERLEYPYMGDDNFPSIKFNGKDNVKGVRVLASFNRYDAVGTIGEDKIREEVKKAYNEWLKTDDAKYLEQEDPDAVADRFVKELKANYGKAEASTDFMLYDDDNVKAFAKDLKTYNNTTLEYVAIMPKTESLTSYIDKVTVEDINNVINNLKEMKIENFKEGYATIIEGDIPLFKYEYELDLLNDLKKLGITDVFDKTKANLGSMLKNANGASIVEAKHKAVIEFSNEGIKAAAATEEGGLGNANFKFNYLFEVPTVRIDLTFDKPYLYLIRDKASGEVWFIGTVYEPTTK